MKIQKLAILCSLAMAVALPAWGKPIITGADFNITEQGESLTTDFGGTISGTTDNWTITLPTGWSAIGLSVVPEPAGESGFNIVWAAFGSTVHVLSDVPNVGTISQILTRLGVPQISQSIGYLIAFKGTDARDLIFHDLAATAVPDGSSTILLLGVGLLGLLGFSRCRLARTAS